MHFVVFRLSKSGLSFGQTAFIFEQSAFQSCFLAKKLYVFILGGQFVAHQFFAYGNLFSQQPKAFGVAGHPLPDLFNVALTLGNGFILGSQSGFISLELGELLPDFALYELFLDRCKRHTDDPPTNWDPIFSHLSK